MPALPLLRLFLCRAEVWIRSTHSGQTSDTTEWTASQARPGFLTMFPHIEASPIFSPWRRNKMFRTLEAMGSRKFGEDNWTKQTARGLEKARHTLNKWSRVGALSEVLLHPKNMCLSWLSKKQKKLATHCAFCINAPLMAVLDAESAPPCMGPPVRPETDALEVDSCADIWGL